MLSFHGWTGSGKNYLASMVRKAMYKKDDESAYAHLFVSTLHFPHVDEVPTYQVIYTKKAVLNSLFRNKFVLGFLETSVIVKDRCLFLTRLINCQFN